MIKRQPTRVPELARLKINHYYSFALTNKYRNVFAIERIEKIGNHNIFNQIFENENVDVRILKCYQMLNQVIDYVITRQSGKSSSLLVYLNETLVKGEPRYDGLMQGESQSCQLGYGKVNGKTSDAVLFRVTDDLVFELYIVEGGKPYLPRLFKIFTTGGFDEEIKVLRSVIPQEEASTMRLSNRSVKHGQPINNNKNLLTIS